MTGLVFGYWGVIKLDEYKESKSKHWICKCRCGNISSVSGASLRSGESTKCKDCFLEKLHLDNKISKKMVGEKNPFYGKKHTKETKIKMSKNHADFTGDKNPLKNKLKKDKTLHDKLSKAAKKRWENKTEEERKITSEKMSKSQSESINKNILNSYHSHHWLSEKCENLGFLRSSWEIKFVEALEYCCFVNNYFVEPYSIQYKNKNDEIRYYKIDFLVNFENGNSILVEIKPKWRFQRDFYKLFELGCYGLENNIQTIIITDNNFKDEYNLSLYDILENAYQDKYKINSISDIDIKTIDGLINVI